MAQVVHSRMASVRDTWMRSVRKPVPEGWHRLRSEPMSLAVAPYPPNLTWQRVMPRLFILNQVMVTVGALSLHATEVLSPQQPQELGLLYYFIWLQCVGLMGLLLTANAMLWVTRKSWRAMPDAQARYDREGLYKGLPTKAKLALLGTTLLCLVLGAWLAQQAFIAIQHSEWGLQNLPQTHPLLKLTLFNASYGTLAIYVFEYFQDRTALSEARARMAHQLTAEAQLDVLRSQLDPHMLFNTLSNLYELIDDSPKQARVMLLHLIDFLRSTLQGSRATQHALIEEFKLASDYLSLMQIRMGDRLQTVLSLPDGLRDVAVPAMLLQPLIENAIKHGLEPRKQGGELSVSARADETQLVLSVRNTTADQPNGGQATPRSHQGMGFGLQYVTERLATLYGPLAQIEMTHHENPDATEVTIRLPMQALSHVA